MELARFPLRCGASLAMLIVLLATQGCAVEWTRKHELYCRMDEQTQIRDTLYFSRSIPGGGEVDDAAWNVFEPDVIAKTFPNGFTVFAANGARRGTDGATSSEPSRVVVIVHADDAVSDAAIRYIVNRYRATFNQEAVLRERTAVCASF